MGVRFFLLSVAFALLYVALGATLYQLQVEQADYYIKKVQARTEYQERLELRRGQIFATDKHGNNIPLALNKDYPFIYAVPKEIIDPSETAYALADVIGVSAEELEDVFADKERLFHPLIEKASSEQIEVVHELKLPGIHLGEKQHRFYPFQKLAAQLVGFVGVNRNVEEPTGLYGLEQFYNEKLAAGGNIYLTIDRTIQAEAEQVISELIEGFGAVSGTVIVQRPSTGEILALANGPTFDPNKYSVSPVQNFINPAVQYVYEPGSVFKPFTMASGIDLGVITPETTYIDIGTVTLNNRTISNWDGKAHGEISMTRVLERSVNTGAVFAVQQIGRESFVQYLTRFGFGARTDTDIPNEVVGSISNLTREGVREIDVATASFGQGIAVTPIQLINAYSSIANDGVLMRPYVNRELGQKTIRRVIQSETTQALVAMMESAVDKAIVAAIPGYKIAGKTGTAQIPDFKLGGYSDDYIHSFVGFGPVSDPKFVILVKLDKPNVVLAGQTVVPAFREFAQFILNYYGIAPDNLEISS